MLTEFKDEAALCAVATKASRQLQVLSAVLQRAHQTSYAGGVQLPVEVRQTLFDADPA